MYIAHSKVRETKAIVPDKKSKKEERYADAKRLAERIIAAESKKVEDECELLRRRVLNQEEYEYYLERKNKQQQAI
jgi:hypothetical protein